MFPIRLRALTFGPVFEQRYAQAWSEDAGGGTSGPLFDRVPGLVVFLAGLDGQGDTMNAFRHASEVEFTDRLSDYWEVIRLCVRPETVLKRVQKLIAQTGEPRFREFEVAVSVTARGFFVQFSARDAVDAENFATLLALTLGWKPEHGMVHGRT